MNLVILSQVAIKNFKLHKICKVILGILHLNKELGLHFKSYVGSLYKLFLGTKTNAFLRVIGWLF